MCAGTVDQNRYQLLYIQATDLNLKKHCAEYIYIYLYTPYMLK